ncbi:O-methyltransferase, family II [Desulfosarcina variabilis str. Montpellier]|uniref:methyltransferase n=1 Tax=Desulfosarcina variabilis TaxID=2300 RepID=UPI003AFB80DC
MRQLKEQLPLMKNPVQESRLTNRRFMKYRVFLTAIELKLFDRLTTPQSAALLAKRAGTHAGMTQKLLDVLETLGFVVKTNKGYCNTEETTAFFTAVDDYFPSGSLDYLRGNAQLSSGATDRIINSPKLVEKKARTYKPEMTHTMANSRLVGRLQEMVNLVTALPGFDNARRLLDIGGAHGLFAIAMCKENPRLSAVVFDQPGMTDVTAKYIAAYGMPNRITTAVGQQGVDRFAHGFDIVFESFISFGNKTHLVNYFTRIHDALAPGGLLVSVRSMLDHKRQGPVAALLWDMKNAVNGSEEMCHTASELFSILGEVGFSPVQWRTTKKYQIMATKKY